MRIIRSKVAAALVCFILLFLSTGKGFAQSNDLDAEFQKFENTHIDTLSNAMYIDSAFMARHKLKANSSNLKRMKVWDNPSVYESIDFIKVCDIRWKFNTKAEAEDFFKKFMSENSENGEEIVGSDVALSGTSDLKVFRESGSMKKMMQSMGKPMNFYYFLFVVDKIVVKVFVCAKPIVGINDAFIFAAEAAKKTIAYSASVK